MKSYTITETEFKRMVIACFIFFGIMLFAGMKAFSQNAKVDATGNYQSITKVDNAKGKATGKTFTDNKGNVYPVMLSERGKLYYIRTSKTGNVYKAYLKVN